MVIYEVSVGSPPVMTNSDQYQVLTGTPPFARRGKTELACKVVLEDERPPRPRDSEKLGFSDKIWETLRRCWEKKPSARPSIGVVSARLKRAAETWVVDVPAFMLASRAGVEQVMNLKQDQAKEFADMLDEVRPSRFTQPFNRSSDFDFRFQTLDQIGISQHSGKTYLKYLQKLCGASGVLPTSLRLTEGFDDIEARPLTCGGFVDVYKATYKGLPVVAKALKTTSIDDLENTHKVSGLIFCVIVQSP
jgi:hypothetical protein